MSNFYEDVTSVRKKRENNVPNTEIVEQEVSKTPEPKKKGSGKKDDESKVD